MALRHSPLDAEHRALHARMAEFGGWEMPIQYRGVLEEHRACRERAVVFDVSHLGTLRVHGEGALALLQWAFTNDLDRIEPGRAQYTHLLDPDDAHVVDDLIVWWVAPRDFLVMPNASNTRPLLDALHEGPGMEVAVEDITAGRVVLAVQGPHARELLGGVAPGAAAVGRFRVAPVTYPRGAGGWAAGTGYTGEDGVELHVPTEAAVAVWQAVMHAGIAPAGLGARDTLRLEAGLPLHGHELGPGITPFQAGLGWVVRFDKGDFRGRAALEAEKQRGIARRLRGLLLDGRQIPRAGHDVLRDGEVVGAVTSGNFSPTLERGIALAFVPPDVVPGDALAVDIRGKSVAATVAELPFVRR
ncbi:MAG: glycine cleavage system aminomethyltransferase GcvT [Acidimicrobiia bacterium]